MKFRKLPAIPENSRLKSIASGTAEVFKLDPRHITRDPGFNKRYDFGDIQILAEDILANGVLESLKVRKEGSTVFLVNGDRRLSAIQLLIRENLWPQDPKNPGFPMPVPCTSEGAAVKPLDRIFMMLSLNTGKPFTLLEKGLAYQDILALDSTIIPAEIARRSGETKQAVSNALTLATTASPALLRHVTDGSMAATTALEICKAHSTHPAQEAAATKALEAAKTNGHSRITPKDLPKKQPKPTKDLWGYLPSEDHQWNASKVAETPNSLFAMGTPRLGITQISLSAAEMPNGTWRHSFHYQTTKCGGGSQPNKGGTSHPDESTALIAAWTQLAPYLVSYAKECAPLTQAAILAYATFLGHALHAQFPTGQDADDSLFALDPSDPSDPSDDDDEDEDEDDAPDPVIDDRSKDAPDDPSAYDRLKNAPPSNRDGSSSSGSGGSGGSGYATPDKRVKNIETLLDEIDESKCVTGRFATVELILDYLNGNHTIATIRDHLLKA
jgi:ParB-like chromosome segregation protein Spo0J